MTQRSFLMSCLLAVFVLFHVTVAVPQWHNSTDGRQYFIEGELKYNWFQAQHECARKNLQLVEIYTEAKNQALVELLKSIFGNPRNLWLGANDEFSQDRNFQRPFYWDASGKQMTFSYWTHNNPDNFRSNEHCVHIWNQAPDFRWNDIQCDFGQAGYICEEHYAQVAVSKAAAEKQKTLTQTMTKLLRDYQEQQKLQSEKLENAQKDILKDENDMKVNLEIIQTKLESDITQALAQHKKEMNLLMADRNKKILSLNMEMHSAAEVMSKKFASELETVQTFVNKLAVV